MSTRSHLKYFWPRIWCGYFLIVNNYCTINAVEMYCRTGFLLLLSAGYYIWLVIKRATFQTGSDATSSSKCGMQNGIYFWYQPTSQRLSKKLTCDWVRCSAETEMWINMEAWRCCELRANMVLRKYHGNLKGFRCVHGKGSCYVMSTDTTRRDHSRMAWMRNKRLFRLRRGICVLAKRKQGFEADFFFISILLFMIIFIGNIDIAEPRETK